MKHTEYTQGACIITLKAAANLAKRRFVTFAGALCGAGAKAAGVNTYAADSGQTISVQTDQVIMVEAGGTITLGAAIASDATGKAVVVADTAITNGYALAAGASGEYLPILLK